jgi:hypothetical protein
MAHYETNLRSIGNFGTVEDFWRYFHHIVKPTEMEVSALLDERLRGHTRAFAKNVRASAQRSHGHQRRHRPISSHVDRIYIGQCQLSFI